ncbi:uncharacterized protein F54H12.2-like [Mytilus edulis]|uniref:uncharacterized protein F54H12.2-like n=1 Tax=Mytilus edulis TaxID=6550 RepID=UPI0039EEA9DA
MDKLSESLALFDRQPRDTGLLGREWIEYRPINQLVEESPIEFNIPATSTSYLDLERLKLHIKLQLRTSDGSPVTADNLVGLVNVPLSSIFSQVEMSLQHQAVNHVGTNYAYKAYFDMILNSNVNDQNGKMSAWGFHKDRGPDIDEPDPESGPNTGLYMRYKETQSGRICDYEGPLFLDLCQQKRLVLNGVPIQIKLWPHKNAFRLMSPETNPDYKVHIVDAYLKVCTVKPNSGIMLGHNEALKASPALYPYMKSTIKTYSLAAGIYSFSAEDLFLGNVPNSLVISCVSSESFNGSYKKNPFKMFHYNCNYLNFMVDGQNFPSRPLVPNYAAGNFVEAYQTLYSNTTSALHISRGDYTHGYCMYVIDFQDGDDTSILKKGQTRVEMKFATPLPEPITVIMYARFSSLLEISQSRAVTI